MLFFSLSTVCIDALVHWSSGRLSHLGSSYASQKCITYIKHLTLEEGCDEAEISEHKRLLDEIGKAFTE